MRLTLRVLLAYLDNILEPADAATVEAKIAESETVSTLVHHIREISKRVRIPAPEVLGKGLGLDPNTVAEYLDYGLSDAAVPDFESVCMQSDIHMAEVAACHEILSLVLVKPAEIDPNARQRMYGLLDEVSTPLTATPLTAVPVAAPVATPAASVAQRAAAAPTTAPAEPRRKAEVPDYLRTSDDGSGKTAGRLALAAAILFALIFVGGAALAFVPHESLPAFAQPLAQSLFGNGPELADKPDEDLERLRVHPHNHPTGTATPTGTAPLPSPTGTDSSTAGLRQPESVSVVGPTPTATGVAPIPPLPAGTVVAAIPATTVPVGTVPAGTIPPTTVVAVPAATGTTVVIPAPVGPQGSAAPVTVIPAAGTTVAVVGPPVANPPVAVATAKIEPVGRISSDPAQVILRYDARAGWVRLKERNVLMVGDRLLALPAFRPQLALNGNIMVDMLGGTAVELLPLDASGTAGVRLLHGRITMIAAGATQGKLVLEVGNRRATVALAAAEFAAQHAFHRPRGIDPAAGPLPWSLTMYVKSGEVVFSDDKGAGPPMKGPTSWLITGTSPLEPLSGANLPLWISADERDLLEKQAADFVEAALREDKAVNVALEEIVEDRRIENQMLALRSLAELGDFNDFTPLLRDATQRWASLEKYLELLSTTADYGPYHADRIREAFNKQAGPAKGGDLYRMLCGYNDDQLRTGVAKALVETLEHDDLDYRVLAFWNLSRITGLTLTYLPQDPPLKRKAAVVKWQQKLDAGQIVFKKN